MKPLTKKNKHIKGFDCRQWKIKHMNKHIKGFNMSIIKHMRQNRGFSEIKFIMKMLLKQFVYMIPIFPVLEKISIDFFQFFKLFSVILECKHITQVNKINFIFCPDRKPLVSL